jgi:UDP-N-acetylmuramate--alanine ligase
VFIDDYAHHPEELRACISSVRAIYQGRRITGIFQPHLFSRTRDFMDSFARSLELLDDVILLDIYPARELPIEGITSSALLNLIARPSKQLCTKEELAERISSMHPEVLLTLGAGDIDALVQPLKNRLEAEQV